MPKQVRCGRALQTCPHSSFHRRERADLSAFDEHNSDASRISTCNNTKATTVRLNLLNFNHQHSFWPLSAAISITTSYNLPMKVTFVRSCASSLTARRKPWTCTCGRRVNSPIRFRCWLPLSLKTPRPWRNPPKRNKSQQSHS